MSQENVEVVRRGAEAIGRADEASVLELAAEDVVFEPLRSSVEGAYRGHDGLRRFMRDTAANFDLFEVEYDDLRDLGDRVLAVGTVTARGRGSAAKTTVETAALFTFRDGLIVHYKDYGDRRKALEAAMLRE